MRGECKLIRRSLGQTKEQQIQGICCSAIIIEHTIFNSNLVQFYKIDFWNSCIHYLFSSTSNTVSIFQIVLSLEAATARRSQRSFKG